MSNPSERRWRWSQIGAALFALGFPGVFTWVYFVALRESPAALQQTAYAIGKTIQFAFPLFWVLLIERRRLAWSRPGAAGMGEGLAFGLAVFAAAVALYFVWLKPAGLLQEAGGEVQTKIAGFGVRSIAAYFVLAMFYSLIHSFLEEYYWRWFVFGQLRGMIPWKAAVGVSSVGFTAHHVILLATYFGWSSPATYLFSLAVAVGGAFWAWLYQRSQSLYGPWVSHLLIDAAIFAVGFDLVRPMFR
jgi:membrane protease YdiL (CAAX protease family)